MSLQVVHSSLGAIISEYHDIFERLGKDKGECDN